MVNGESCSMIVVQAKPELVWFSSWSCKHINGNLIGQWKRQQHNHRHNGTRLGSADHHCQWTTNWTTRLDYKLRRIALNLRLAWTHHRKLGQREQQFVIIGTASFNKRTLILGHNHSNRRWPADRVRTIDNDARALTENIDRWSLPRRHDRIPYRRASQWSDEIELSRSVLAIEMNKEREQRIWLCKKNFKCVSCRRKEPTITQCGILIKFFFRHFRLEITEGEAPVTHQTLVSWLPQSVYCFYWTFLTRLR